PWMVSSSVRPVNTRMVNCFSCAVSVFHDGMSLDTGTFSGNQKLPVSRSHTSASFSSCRRFQLIAETRSISFTLSVTTTPFRRRTPIANQALRTLPLVGDNPGYRNIVCLRTRPDEFVLRSVELAGGPPILPRHAAPQAAVDAMLVEVPAAAATRVPHRTGQVVLQV